MKLTNLDECIRARNWNKIQCKGFKKFSKFRSILEHFINNIGMEGGEMDKEYEAGAKL